MNRYFIALVLPTPLFEQVLQWKHYFKEHYNSKASLHSPPHITLHMPFEWRSEKESELVEGMRALAMQLYTVQIELNGFGCFTPRVIFVNVVQSPRLTSLQNLVRQYCKRHLGLFNADYQDRPFHPHVTVAFRDLKKSMFAKAWESCKEKSFKGEFTASRVALLKHDGRKWNIHQEFDFPA